MANLITFYPQHRCPACGMEHAIRCITDNNASVPLDDIMQDITLLDKFVIEKMKCIHCEREFMIDWTRPDRIPLPMINFYTYNIYFDPRAH